ncbi:MAG TPA: hypothetical protein VKG78_01380 [Opitutaceae bacterium]|nr:hypothetical protein [Opitutaceae bacterium]
MRTILSPLEKAILAECTQTRAYAELLLDLSPIYEDPREVKRAIRFLAAHQLLDGETVGLDDIENVRRSELGEHVLRHQQRQEDLATTLIEPTRRLYLVGSTR